LSRNLEEEEGEEEGGNVYKQTRGMSFTFISTKIKIKYNYNIIHINTEFVQICKKFPSLLTPRCGRS